MKYKISIIRVLLFIGLFVLMDSRYLFSMEEYAALKRTIMSPSIGYNNEFLVIGIILTIICGFSTYFLIDDNIPVLIRSYTRIKIINNHTSIVIKDNLVSSLSFVGVPLIVLSIASHFDYNAVLDLLFAGLLYFVYLSSYLCLVSVICLLFHNIFNNEYGFIVALAVVSVYNFLNHSLIKLINLTDFSFLYDWSLTGSVDIMRYSKNVIINSVIAIVMYEINTMIETKRDYLK